MLVALLGPHTLVPTRSHGGQPWAAPGFPSLSVHLVVAALFLPAWIILPMVGAPCSWAWAVPLPPGQGPTGVSGPCPGLG